MSPLSDDRLPCQTPGCPNTIQPATAVRTGGYCGPCAGKQKKAARAAYIQANRRDVDRFAGITDPVEMLRLMHTPPKYDPLVNLLPPPKTIEELYLALTPEQATRLMHVAAEMLPIDEHRADSIGSCLAAFTDFDLDTMLNLWIDQGRIYPGLVFRNAGASVRDRLIAYLRTNRSQVNANHALSALAWVGDAAVEQALIAFDAEKPAWSSQLHISPTDYARVAGWELVAGKRRELTVPTSVALHIANDGEPDSDRVRIMQSRFDACPWCGSQLVNLLEAQLADPPLDALAHTVGLGNRIEVPTCRICTCFGAVHADLDPQGHGRWASENVRPDFLPGGVNSWAPSPWSKTAVRFSPRRPTHAADWSLPTTLSQIGGFPGWVQDLAYPDCLKCGQTMIFLAQIDQAAFRGHEGVYYAFICPACRTTASAYQQT